MPWEEAAVFDEAEATGFEFLAGLGFGHFVEGFDGDAVILAAEFHEEDASAGFEGAVEGGEHFLWV